MYRDAAIRKQKNSEWCKKHPEQHRQNQRDFHKRHPHKSREYRLRSRYKLTVEQWQKLYNAGCWLCKKPFLPDDKPFVEHCHTSNYVRGLAHQQCNSVVGYANDSVELLRALADSLESYFCS